MEMIISMLPFIGMALAMYFFMVRPQKRAADEKRRMLDAMKKGDAVITIGGLHGIVDEIHPTTVVIDCEGVYLTFERSAIAIVKQSVHSGATPLESVNTSNVVNGTE